MQYVVAILLGVYFLFFLEHTFSAEFYQKISDFSFRDWASVAFVPVLLISSAIIARRYKKDRLNSREIFWVSVIVATLMLPLIIPYTKTESGIAIVCSAYLASIGWLYTNHNTLKNQRKSHTMSVLIQLRNSAEYQKHRVNVFTKFPMGTGVTEADLPQLKKERTDPSFYIHPDKVPLQESMIFILNYFEFISIGVLTEDLDATMIELSMRSIFLNWHKHLLPVIAERQERNPTVFTNFTNLIKNYEKTR